jgi:hypothetical protein
MQLKSLANLARRLDQEVAAGDVLGSNAKAVITRLAVELEKAAEAEGATIDEKKDDKEGDKKDKSKQKRTFLGIEID